MKELAAAAGGVFSTAISDWNKHEICPRDRAILAAALHEAAGSAHPGFADLPCDILRAPAVPCNLPPPSPPPAPPGPAHVSGCWRGATPPCVYGTTTASGVNPTAWTFVAAAGSAIHLVNNKTGQCLTYRGSPGPHTQLTLSDCAQAGDLALWTRNASDGSDTPTFRLVPTAAPSLCVNIGLPVASPSAEVQLYNQCGSTDSNTLFMLNPSGVLYASQLGVSVTVCETGEPACVPAA